MEKENKIKDEKSRNSSIDKPEEERVSPKSAEGLDNETIQILLDDRVSTGG